LSEGQAGEVQGGDRLPWVGSADGDNFMPLRLLSWQVHVYGTASAALSDAAARLGLPVQVLTWSKTADQAGLKRDAAYLVRPDGYIALASPDQDAPKLHAFAVKLRLRFAPSNVTKAANKEVEHTAPQNGMPSESGLRQPVG
jgi:hypothetical protein